MGIVPWRLDPVDHNEHLLHEVNAETGENHCHSELTFIFDVARNFVEVEIKETNHSDEHADNITLACPLTSLSFHEILSDDNYSR